MSNSFNIEDLEKQFLDPEFPSDLKILIASYFDIKTIMAWCKNNPHLKHSKLCINGVVYRNILQNKYPDDLNKQLYYAGEYGLLPVVEYLVKQGADVNYHLDNKSYNKTVLTVAARNGHLEVVKYLVENEEDPTRGSSGFERERNKANIHAKDEALQEAARSGHLEVVKFLVENNANIHSRDDEALRSAAKNGYLDVVKYLVEKGANIHAWDDSALVWAADSGHLDVVKYLVEKGANIHAYDDSALVWAAKFGNLEVVKFLVENNANIHADDDDALREASDNRHLDVVKYLAENKKPGHQYDKRTISILRDRDIDV